VGAGKVMGLAPYGISENHTDIPYAKFGTPEDLYSYSENAHSNYLYEEGKSLNATAAFNIQQLMEMQLENVLTDLYEMAVREKVEPNICISGGGALNSVANQVAFARSKFDRLHIHPASGDDGTAVGAALWYWYDQLDHPKGIFSNREIMYSVASYDQALEEVLGQRAYKEKIRVEKREDFIDIAASYLAQGKIIGWFQGSSEVGPRALGNRSILADPRNPEMKDILNKKVKFREAFRSFAPSVLNEHAEEWFGLKDSPFMLRVCTVLKDEIPAVTHVDGTARIQTVTPADNPNYYRLIDSFYHLTGVPVLLNTSFNIKGLPIVETPKDAIDCFLDTEMDVLVFENMIILKADATTLIAGSEKEIASSIAM
jgi:carbamoyltransferase